MEDILAWLGSRGRDHRRDPERIQRLLDRLDYPQAHLSAFHVTGTNGKGSVSVMLHLLLREHGVRSGLFTSPHLLRFRERIRVDGVAVPENRLREFWQPVATAAAGIDCSGFEAITALMFCAFSRLQVPVAVLEVGVGGAGDPTRLAGHPLATVLTSVAMDHEDRIGPTLEDIAREKAGLIRPGVPVVAGVLSASAEKIVRQEADARGSPLYRLGEDFRISVRHRSAEGICFDWEGFGHRWGGLFLPLPGAFQVANAGLALAAFVAAQGLGVPMREEAVRRALARVRWPGRMDLVRRRPLILLDGAHNEAAFAALGESLRELWPHRRRVLVLGTSRNHRLGEAAGTLVREADRLILTRSRQEKAVDPGELALRLPGCGGETAAQTDAVAEALALALEAAGPEDLLVVTGSLFVVGEAMAALGVDADAVIRPEGA